MSRLGDTIRTARLKAKMTEKALGKKCGMAENVIKDIESGRRIVSDDQAQRILKVLGVANPISTELDVAAEPEVKLPYASLHGVWRGNCAFYIYASPSRAFILPDGQYPLTPVQMWDHFKEILPKDTLHGRRP